MLQVAIDFPLNLHDCDVMVELAMTHNIYTHELAGEPIRGFYLDNDLRPTHIIYSNHAIDPILRLSGGRAIRRSDLGVPQFPTFKSSSLTIQTVQMKLLAIARRHLVKQGRADLRAYWRPHTTTDDTGAVIGETKQLIVSKLGVTTGGKIVANTVYDRHLFGG